MAAPPPPLPPSMAPPPMGLGLPGGGPGGPPPPPLPPPMMSSSQHPTSAPSSITTLSKLNPTTIILTHIPPFLRHPRNLRDLLYSTTSIKHVFYSCAIKRFANDNNVKDDGNDDVVAVVKFSHAANALSLIRNWKFVKSKLNEGTTVTNDANNDDKTNAANDNDDDADDKQKKEKKKQRCQMNAFLLYTDGPISLHPEKSQVDAGMIQTIWEMTIEQRDVSTDTGKVAQQADDNMITSLVETYKMIEKRQKELDNDAAKNGVDGSNGFNLSSTYATTVTSALNDDSNTNSNAEEKGGGGGGRHNPNALSSSSNHEDKVKLDSAKVRAAAGGGAYDEEADPLNAPEVLEAVKQFKKKLEVTQGGHRRKRKEYLEKRFDTEVKKAKERLVEMRKKERNALPPPPPFPPTLLPPPPPLPPGGMGMPGVPPPQPNNNAPPNRDTGRRGVSNLPAWMTAAAATNKDNEEGSSNKRSADEISPSTEDSNNNEQPLSKKKFIPSEANRDINARKERLVVGNGDEGGSSIAAIRAANEAADKKAKEEEEQRKKKEFMEKAATFSNDEILKGSFPKLDNSRPEAIPTLRAFVKEQLVEYLGEEEATLIDFVMNHLVKNESKQGDNDYSTFMGKTVDGLLEEMKMVLEEDAETFVVDLFKKVLELLK